MSQRTLALRDAGRSRAQPDAPWRGLFRTLHAYVDPRPQEPDLNTEMAADLQQSLSPSETGSPDRWSREATLRMPTVRPRAPVPLTYLRASLRGSNAKGPVSIRSVDVRPSNICLHLKFRVHDRSVKLGRLAEPAALGPRTMPYRSKASKRVSRTSCTTPTHRD